MQQSKPYVENYATFCMFFTLVWAICDRWWVLTCL